MSCCVMGCFRLLFFQLWKVLLAAIIAMVLARADDYIGGRHGNSAAGRAWRGYRGRDKKRPSA